MLLNGLYVLCFDEETGGNEAASQEATTNAAPQPSPTFTQEDVNRFLADDRRKHTERYKALETSYNKALQNQQLSQGERNKLEQDLADLQASFRTKEQQAEFERKRAAQKYEEELNQAKTEAQKWANLYKDSTIDRSILDACDSDVFHPKQILDMLKPKAQLKEEITEDGKPTGRLVTFVMLDDIDEKTGEPIQTLRTPSDAVKRMREIPKLYGNQFRSNVVSGVGAGSADSAGRASGRIDPSRLTPEQYRKMRAENPEALGLPPRRKR